MPVKKLALTAGHYYYTSGKRCLKALDPAETREWQLNDRVADKVQAMLDEYDGIEILRTDDTTGKNEVTLAQRVKKANDFGADFYLSIHHNAGINGGPGGGIVVYVCPGATTAAVWQKKFYNALIAHTGLKGNRSNPLGEKNLYECVNTAMPAVLIENGFMDSKTDVPIILTDAHATKTAEAIVEVIVSMWGLKRKGSQIVYTPPDPPVEDTTDTGAEMLKKVYDRLGDAEEAVAEAKSNLAEVMKATA